MPPSDVLAPSPAPPAGRRWRQAFCGNVLSMGLVSFFTDFSSEMMNPLLPIFIAGLLAGGPGAAGLAAMFVGLMEGIAETTAALLKIFSGRISDAMGKRKALVLVGYGISSAVRPLMALAGAVAHVIVLKFFDRIGKGIRTSPRDALIGDSVPKEVRGLAFSFHRAMDHLGAVLGPIVAIGLLYLLLGKFMWKGSTSQPADEEINALRWLFAIAVIPGALAMLSLFFMVREIAPASEKKAAPGSQEQSRTGAWSMPGRFWMFVASVTIFALGNSSDLFIVFLGWTNFGLGLTQIVLLWIALHVSKIIFSFPGGMLSDKIGRGPVIIAGWLFYALVYLGLGWVQEVWQFAALVAGYGFYHGMTEGAEKALVADFVPSERRGTAFGIYHGAVGLAAFPASMLFGLFWMELGPAVAFSIGASLAGVAGILLACLLLSGRKGPPQNSKL
ncbi:MAG: MFS transporter [Planctomycetes bacterium]|nr:MFS transporter [Planctomycetota bacterium]